MLANEAKYLDMLKVSRLLGTTMKCIAMDER